MVWGVGGVKYPHHLKKNEKKLLKNLANPNKFRTFAL
jgi:hypothetical protein